MAAALISLPIATWADGRSEMFPAFPGAEGAGAYTPGGRCGRVLFVTTLEDYMPGKQKPIAGSFRWAVNAKGPRIVLFRVGGTINLVRDVDIQEPFITIAGQSAPGGGICLKGSNLGIDAHDVVLRYLRIRPGDIQQRELDAISCNGRNVLIDHCSTSWAIDEVLSTNGDSANVTVQWCLITESLNRSFHHKGAHGYGSLISGPGEITYHHNVYGWHRSRNPRPGDVLLDFRNNLIFGWGDRAGYCGNDRLRMNYVGNYLNPLKYSKSPRYAFLPGGVRPKIYMADNRHSSSAEATADNWRLVRPPSGLKPAETRQKLEAAYAFPTSEVTTDSADEAYRRILSDVGATLPARDAVDTRVVDQIRSGGGHLINSQEEVGGWPVLAAGTAPVDADGDGMPDAWESAHGLDPRRAARPGEDTDGDRYTDIEEFLNGTDPQKKDAWIDPPTIASSAGEAFVGATRVTLAAKSVAAVIRYTLDDRLPDASSPEYKGPFELDRSATVRVRAFVDGHASHVRNLWLERLVPFDAVAATGARPGLRYEYFERDAWNAFPDFSTLTVTAAGEVPNISLEPRRREIGFGLRLSGLFQAPRDGIYRFHLRCSPIGQILIHDALIAENQGRKREHVGAVALKAGMHPFTFQIYYGSDENKTLAVSYEGPGIALEPLPNDVLYHVSEGGKP